LFKIAKRIFLIALFGLLIGVAHSADKTLTWDANTETDLAGYKIYYAPIGIETWTAVNVGNVTQYSRSALGILEDGHNYYVTAYDTSGNESGPSNVIDDVSPSPPSGCRWLD